METGKRSGRILDAFRPWILPSVMVLLAASILGMLGTLALPAPAAGLITLLALTCAGTLLSGRMYGRLCLAHERVRQARDGAIGEVEAKGGSPTTCACRFRIPLNAVIGFCELAEEEIRSNEIAHALQDLQKVSEAARQILQLVDDLVEAAELDAGVIALCVVSFDVGEIVQQTVDSLAPQAREYGNRFEVVVAEDVREIESDPIRIGQIFANLVSNAVKFTRNGVVRIEVRREDAATVLFKVEDTGIGIAAVRLPGLFTETVPMDPARTAGVAGTGLGLSITHKLCTLLGGTISAASSPDSGSAFTVRLPIRRKGLSCA